MLYLGDLVPKPNLSLQAAERFAQLSAVRTTKSKPATKRLAVLLHLKTA